MLVTVAAVAGTLGLAAPAFADWYQPAPAPVYGYNYGNGSYGNGSYGNDGDRSYGRRGDGDRDDWREARWRSHERHERHEWREHHRGWGW